MKRVWTGGNEPATQARPISIDRDWVKFSGKSGRKRLKAYNLWLCRSHQTSGNNMPIYAYKCAACGFAKDLLQKMSDDPLTDCPQCHKPSFSKQLTAAGFQLKGSGWYATDFKTGSSPAAAPAAGGDTGTSTATEAPSKPDTPAATASACAPSCACH